MTVRIGVFFDGTGNNRVNSQIGADCRAMAGMNNKAHSRECKGRHDDPGSSYSNDLSNIARLAGLYCRQPVAIHEHNDEHNGWYVYWPVYVSGVGTISAGRDSFWPGQSFGRGATGVIAKVGRSMEKLGARLEAFAADNPGCVMDGLELDVFGFSRGAAAARHFVNEILKQRKGALEPVLNPRKVPLSADFSWDSGSVRIKFIGLFDTVAAIGSLKDLGNLRDACNRRVNLYLPPGCADQVLHLVARDELRRNFALNSVHPGWPREIVLPGAHSDLGGGYHPHMEERVMLTRPRWSTVACDIPREAIPAWQQAFEELHAMDTSQWIDPLDKDAAVFVVWEESPPRTACSKTGVKSVMATVCLQRKVFGHLSRVHLRVMHALACDEGVPFQPVPDRQDLGLMPELQPITEKLIAYARGGEYQLDRIEEQILRRRYIHRSAHWGPALGRQGSVMDALFVHAPQRGARVRHPNIVVPGYPH